MKGRDDHTAWDAPDDEERLVTRVDSKRENRIINRVGPPPEKSNLAGILIPLVVGALGLGAIIAYKNGLFSAGATPPPVTGSAAKGDAPPPEAYAAVAGVEDAGSAAIPPPPPPDDLATEPEEPQGPAIGDTAVLGKVSIEVEHFWFERGVKGPACAALCANLGNADTEAMTLPALEVTLVDAAGRHSKPSKQKQAAATGAINPGIKTKYVWVFQIPAGTEMRHAQFKSRDGALRVSLAARTAENEALVTSDEYAKEFEEIVMFASPRAAGFKQYDEARWIADQLGGEIETARKQAAKLESRAKACNRSLEIAQAALAKPVAAIEAAKARLQELESKRSDFRHNARAQEAQLAKAETDLVRAARDAEAAAKTVSEKKALVDKALGDLKEASARLAALQTRYDNQQKALQALEKKLAQ